MTFHSVGNFIIPTDEFIFFRGVAQPPTSEPIKKDQPFLDTFVELHLLVKLILTKN